MIGGSLEYDCPTQIINLSEIAFRVLAESIFSLYGRYS